MELSLAQKQTLKTWLTTNASGLNNEEAAALLNAFPTPDFWVWRTNVSKAEIVQKTSIDGTTFNWVGNGFITRSVGELTAWQEMFNGSQAINPSLANVRTAFSDIFSGTGNAAANRTHLLTVARRKATVAEKLFAAGTGTTASPAVMGVGAEGEVTGDDVSEALNS